MADPLPPPRTSGGQRLHDAIARRRSVRDFGPDPVSADELSQLLWGAQGITGSDERRTAPSAGGLYPLALHVLSADGVHRYVPQSHALERVVSADRRERLAHACLDQEFVGRAPVVLVLAERRGVSRGRYGVRADRYAALEAGHAAQNMLLEATSLGLAAVPVGAFYDDEVRRDAELGEKVDPLYVIPVGRPAAPAGRRSSRSSPSGA